MIAPTFRPGHLAEMAMDDGGRLELKRVYLTGGRWYGTPEASTGWVYVYQQHDTDHYELISKIKARRMSFSCGRRIRYVLVLTRRIGEALRVAAANSPVYLTYS
jgi:hypothetical protein